MEDKLQQKINKLIADDAEQRKRTWDHYAELKKTNPKLYLDPKISKQMHDDALALGEGFFNEG